MAAGNGPTPVKLAVGTVIDVLSGARFYLVALDDFNVPSIPCRDITGQGNGPYGPRPLGVYAPGTSVLVTVFTQELEDAESGDITYVVPESHGYIMGAAASSAGDNNLRSCDWIAPFTGADALNDEVHRHIISVDDASFQDFNQGQPCDAVAGSDQGYITDVGCGYGTSRFFSWLRASDMSGIWCFYFDNLTRIAAYNYEFWHAGGDRYIKNDEGEVNDVELFSPYPWEALGKVDPNSDAGTDIADGGIYKPGQKSLGVETQQTDQLALPRHIKLRGYVADLLKEMVVKPRLEESSPGGDAATTETYSSEPKYTGLLDVQQHINGLHTTRSAQGIVHEKYVLLPVPKQKAVPEQADSTGGSSPVALADGATNYRPSGYWGDPTVDATAHEKHAWRWGGASDLWLAELYDYHAYTSNWYGVKVLDVKSRDWYLPNESDTTYGASTPPGSYVFIEGTPSEGDTQLDTKFTLSMPDKVDLQIDHRVGTSRYYYSRSIIAQLNDGSVVIEDGAGSAIHMARGNIHITAPGDVWCRPGRSHIVWAPDDIIQRAGMSVDVTASHGDVRLKAERNLQVLAGNSGYGGILLESRGMGAAGGNYHFCDSDTPLFGEDVSAPGIIMITRDSRIQMYGQGIYGKAFFGGDDTVTGDIVWDADGQRVDSAGDLHSRFAGDGYMDVLNGTLCESAAGCDPVGCDSSSSSSACPVVVNRFTAEYTYLGACDWFHVEAEESAVEGDFFVVGNPVATAWNIDTGNVISAGIATAAASSGETAFRVGSGATAYSTISEHLQTENCEGAMKGDACFIESISFSFRTDAQYAVDDVSFRIAETTWQQMCRHGSTAAGSPTSLGGLWTEPPVVFDANCACPSMPPASSNMYPHPGTLWGSDTRFLRCDTALWDWATRSNKDRATDPYDDVRAANDDYESTESTGAAFTANNFEAAYTVTKPPAALPAP